MRMMNFKNFKKLKSYTSLIIILKNNQMKSKPKYLAYNRKSLRFLQLIIKRTSKLLKMEGVKTSNQILGKCLILQQLIIWDRLWLHGSTMRKARLLGQCLPKIKSPKRREIWKVQGKQHLEIPLRESRY